MKEFKRDREKWRKDLFGNQGLSSADRCAPPLFVSRRQEPMLTMERLLNGWKNKEGSKKIEMTIHKPADPRKSIVSVSALKFN